MTTVKVPVLDIAGSVTTNGGRDTSLVRGQQIQLTAAHGQRIVSRTPNEDGEQR